MPDLIILDLCMPGLSGMDTMRSVIASLPQIKILVLSAKQSSERIKQAFDTGASGYVVKSSLGIDLLEAVQAIIAGHQYTSPAVRRLSSATPGVTRIQLPCTPLLANVS